MTPIEALLRAGGSTGTATLVAQHDGPAHVRPDQGRPMCGTWAAGLNRANVTNLRLCQSCVRVLTASWEHPGKTVAQDKACRARICVRDVLLIVEHATEFEQLSAVDDVLRAHEYIRNAPLPVTSWTGVQVPDLWRLLKKRRMQLSQADTFVERALLEKGMGRAYWDAIDENGLSSPAVAARYA